jgi:hypothetical protein
MLRTILRTAAILISIAAPLAAASAEDDSKLIDGVTPQVAAVETGGSWSVDKKGGFYRAIVLMTGDAKSFGAHVYLQWLAFAEGNPIPTVEKTVAIKEINDQNLANATISIEGEEGKDNEVTLVVSSYDVDADKDIALFVKAGQPGTYAMVKAPPKGAGAPDAGDAPAKKEAPGKED